MDGTEEIYECAGCGGEVPVIDAIWLPEKSEHAKPYCCRECSEQIIKQLKKGHPPMTTQPTQQLTPAQELLKAKHGTPEEFAAACDRAFAGLMITADECEAGIAKYRCEWYEAGPEFLPDYIPPLGYCQVKEGVITNDCRRIFGKTINGFVGRLAEHHPDVIFIRRIPAEPVAETDYPAPEAKPNAEHIGDTNEMVHHVGEANEMIARLTAENTRLAGELERAKAKYERLSIRHLDFSAMVAKQIDENKAKFEAELARLKAPVEVEEFAGEWINSAAQERLKRDVFPRLLREVVELREYKADIEQQRAMVLADKCPTDERHCPCVDVLRARVKELESKNTGLEVALRNAK